MKMKIDGTKRTALALLWTALLPWGAQARDGASKEEEMFRLASEAYQEPRTDRPAGIDALQRFIQEFPDSPRAADAEFLEGEASLRRALALLKMDAVGRKKDARMLPARSPKAVEALHKAQESFSLVLSKYGKRSGLGASAQYRLGEIAYNQKDWVKAIDGFAAVDKSYSKSYLVPEAWMGIIYADLALEHFSRVEANLARLKEAYPTYLQVPSVLYAQGLASLHKGDYVAAEKAFSQVRSDDASYYLGKTYLLSKRPLLAATAFERLVREYPDSEMREESEFSIGDSFFLAKDYDGAISKYRRFLEQYPDSPLKTAALFRIGASYFQNESYAKARDGFQALIDRNAQDFFAPLSQLFIADSYLASNQLGEAEAAYKQVLARFPQSAKAAPAAQYKLAWTQYKAGKADQAAQTCRAFLAQFPTHSMTKNVHLLLGSVLIALNRPDEAVSTWQRVVDLAPASDMAEEALYSILKTQYGLKRYDSILTSYQFLFRNLPPSKSKWRLTSYLYAAEAALALKEVDRAQAIYETILKDYPREPAAFYAQDGLAWCYAYKGKDQKALAERRKLKDMMTAATQSSFAFSDGNELGIADGMYNLRSYEDAFQLYDKFLKENPKSAQAPSAMYRAGMSLYRARYYSQAIDMWQRLITGHPSAPEAQEAVFQVADTQFRSQKYREAVASYQAIIQKFPKSPQLPLAYLRVANSYFNSKDDAGTIKAGAALIARFPEAQEAFDALDLMDAAFERSPKLDFREPLGAIVKANKQGKIAAQAQFRLANRFLERKDFAGAAAEFQNFSVEYTTDLQLAKAQFLLAESLFQGGRDGAAIPAYQRFLNNFPRSDDTPRALFHVGSAHYNRKEYELASQFYQRLVDDYPDSEFSKPALFNLALSLKSLNKPEGAEEAYKKYVDRAGNGSDPNAQAAIWEIFTLQRNRRDYESSLATLRRIGEGNPPNADIQLEVAYNTADVYSAMERPEDALKTLEALKELKPAGNAFRLRGLIKLGELYEKSDPAKAVAVYDDLAKNATNGQLAKSARERAFLIRGDKKETLLGSPGSMASSEDEPSSAPKKPHKRKKAAKREEANEAQ